MEFSKKLLELRKAKGLSQDELGNQLNVSRQTISKWELGETTPEMGKLILLSDYFEISLDKLVKGNESKSDTKEDTTNFNTPKKRINNTLLIVLLIIGFVFLIDFVMMIIYFVKNGFPS
ncbi:helix-turn-helix domain-containing protein [Abyssisolibacter fermentans]|uniref:helix-turn-helix domain-containing protein n=1 Tax=Abyssisolibacter fermentans TaxID=1766203 RepID=UPI0008343C8E|nr:helix-turn-helix transcriptional regulator [Abyssisolibacter fermentans]